MSTGKTEGGVGALRQRAEVGADSEWALDARLRLLTEALRVRGGRVLQIRRLGRAHHHRVNASVDYELPPMTAGIAERLMRVSQLE